MSRRWIPYAFLAPFMVFFALFLLAPILYAVYISLFRQRRQALGPDYLSFEPIANYLRALTDDAFTSSVVNIVLYAAIQVPVMMLAATVIALMLDGGGGRARRFLRFAVFIPYAVPGVIAGLLWSYLYSRRISPANQLLDQLGLGAIDFIEGDVILFSIANIVIWVATGYNAIILYSSLRDVPRELYDAAAIDGASALQVIRFVKLPMIRGTLTLVFVFSLIGALQIFGEPYMLRSLGFVPGDITPNTVVYNAATRDGDYNYAAALAVLLGAATFLLSLLFLWVSTRGRRAVA